MSNKFYWQISLLESIIKSIIEKGTMYRVVNGNFGSKENYWKTSFEKKLFYCVGEYAEYGFDQQRLIWYVCLIPVGYGV